MIKIEPDNNGRNLQPVFEDALAFVREVTGEWDKEEQSFLASKNFSLKVGATPPSQLRYESAYATLDEVQMAKKDFLSRCEFSDLLWSKAMWSVLGTGPARRSGAVIKWDQVKADVIKLYELTNPTRADQTPQQQHIEAKAAALKKALAGPEGEAIALYHAKNTKDNGYYGYDPGKCEVAGRLRQSYDIYASFMAEQIRAQKLAERQKAEAALPPSQIVIHSDNKPGSVPHNEALAFLRELTDRGWPR